VVGNRQVEELHIQVVRTFVQIINIIKTLIKSLAFSMRLHFKFIAFFNDFKKHSTWIIKVSLLNISAYRSFDQSSVPRLTLFV